MPTLDFVYYLALGTTPGMPVEDSVELEEHLSSSSATPIPSQLGIARSNHPTASPVPISDAAEVIRSAGRTMARMAFLPTNPLDEAMVDELLRTREAGRIKRPLRPRS